MKRAKRRPGRPPGHTRDTTRANILRAARVAFAAKGFGVATNRDVAEGAGVTAPAIYQYFGSKAELYAAATDEAVAEVTAHMRADALREGSATASLADIVRSLLALHERDPSLAAFLSALPAELGRHPELARGFKPERTELPGLLMSLFARAVAGGEIRANDARRVAQMFIACVMGLSQYAALWGEGRGPATAFAELLEGGLFVRAPAHARLPRRAPSKPASAVQSRRAPRTKREASRARKLA